MADSGQRDMRSEPRPVASLGPLLLARKGTAKPAMRAQLGVDARGPAPRFDDERQDEIAFGQEDLGWNDMGESPDDSPFGFAADAEPGNSEPDMLPGAAPEVLRQQTRLVHSISQSNIAAFRAQERLQAEAMRRRASECGRRAAFTLRLDEERHLRLKLASTVHGESAQQIVTRALDQLLADMPEIETLAAQVESGGKKNA